MIKLLCSTKLDPLSIACDYSDTTLTQEALNIGFVIGCVVLAVVILASFFKWLETN